MISSKCDYDAAPPAYNEALSPPDNNYNPPPEPRSEFEAQISYLGHQIQLANQQHNATTHDRDQEVLDHIVSATNKFLNEYSSTGLPKAKLIIVPAGKVSKDAKLADEDLRSVDEYYRMETISAKRSYDNDLSFWDDRDTARRLAGHLQPAIPSNPEPKIAALPPTLHHSSASKGFFRRSRSEVAKPTEPEIYPKEKPSTEPKVALDVRAEEITFRTQNPFGLYGTESGWGIVVKIHVELLS